MLVAKTVFGSPRKLKSQCVSQDGPVPTAEKECGGGGASSSNVPQSPGSFKGKNPLNRTSRALGLPELADTSNN